MHHAMSASRVSQQVGQGVLARIGGENYGSGTYSSYGRNAKEAIQVSAFIRMTFGGDMPGCGRATRGLLIVCGIPGATPGPGGQRR